MWVLLFGLYNICYNCEFSFCINVGGTLLSLDMCFIMSHYFCFRSGEALQRGHECDKISIGGHFMFWGIWYCMDRVSFCIIYVISQETQYWWLILFITFSSSTCFGLQQFIFRSVLMLYVAICYASIRYEGEGRTANSTRSTVMYT